MTLDYSNYDTDELASPPATDTSFAAWLALNPPPDGIWELDLSFVVRRYIQEGMTARYNLWVLDEARKAVTGAQVASGESDGEIPF